MSRDYHNDDAVIEDHNANTSNSFSALTAYEKGRQAGELEATRRMQMGGIENQPQQLIQPNKTFAQDQTVIQQQGVGGVMADLVEINQLTAKQWTSAIFGEILSIGYIVLMAIWLGSERTGGIGWSNSDKNGSQGMFNTHVLTAFIGLWFASQAYITYRLLPIFTSTTLNKLWYLFCHLVACTAFALSLAAALMSSPSNRSWSMHAWTAYAALFIYALHALYSCLRIMCAPWGTSVTGWNETYSGVTNDRGISGRHMTRRGGCCGRRVVHEDGTEEVVGCCPMGTRNNVGTSTTAPRNNLGTSEQIRDGESFNTVYAPGPSTGLWRSNREATLDVDARNANLGSTRPRWSETPMLSRHHYFLVPRAKWAVMALMGLMATVLMGISEWQVLLASHIQNWPQEVNGSGTNVNNSGFNGIGFRSDEAIIIGVLGLCTLLGTLAIGYAAVPPRTTLSKAPINNGAPSSAILDRRTSLSTGTTAPNSMATQPQPMEVV
jgi:hypothetical protein